MAYVGRGLTTGSNYQKLDDITVNNVDYFTMNVNSTAVTPAAEHVILAVNGVIQEPNVGFTVSGSTCTLASAIDNVGNGDTIWGVIAGNAAYVNNEFNTESFDVLSSTTSKPVFTLKNTNNGGTSAELQFNNTEAGGAGADGDDLGRITFYGQDDASNNQQFGEILCEISDASTTAEGGKLSFLVAEHDGTMTTAGLVLTDGNADGEIDVTIGAGTSSVTTVAGDLSVTGGNLVFDGTDLTIASTGKIEFTDANKYIYHTGASDILKIVSNGYIRQSTGGTELGFDGTQLAPTADKSLHIGVASYAFDNMYADDFNNVADFYNFDEYDDIAAIKQIKGSGTREEHTGYELIDDDTIPDWLVAKYKSPEPARAVEHYKEGDDVPDGKQVGDVSYEGIAAQEAGDKKIDADGKPYLSLKTLISLLMGAVRQLDAKVEALENE